jgi:predicted RNase H-like HicB family nuclease
LPDFAAGLGAEPHSNRKVQIMSTINVTVAISQEENWYVAKCLENSVASQGKNIEDALKNLKEALQLHFEDITTIPKTPQTFVTTMEIAI